MTHLRNTYKQWYKKFPIRGVYLNPTSLLEDQIERDIKYVIDNLNGEVCILCDNSSFDSFEIDVKKENESRVRQYKGYVNLSFPETVIFYIKDEYDLYYVIDSISGDFNIERSFNLLFYINLELFDFNNYRHQKYYLRKITSFIRSNDFTVMEPSTPNDQTYVTSHNQSIDSLHYKSITDKPLLERISFRHDINNIIHNRIEFDNDIVTQEFEYF